MPPDDKYVEGNAVANNSAPVITIEDIHMLTGSLVETSGYPTYKGRIIAQLAKDALFSGWLEYQNQQKDDNGASPSVTADALRALEDSASAHKSGMDSSVHDAFESNPLEGLKARKELVFDCIKATEDMDDETIAKIVKIVKDRATAEQVASIAKKNPQHRNVTRAIMVGLNGLDYSDESYDGLWLTKAVEFVNQYPSRYPTPDDTANHGLLLAVLTPRVGDGVVAPIVTLDF